jgi:hypothetical protein
MLRVLFPSLKHKLQKVLSSTWSILMVAGLRLAVFLNLIVTGQPGWGGS